MKTDYQIVDNFLDKESFEKIQNCFMGNTLPWFYSSAVATEEDRESFYFIHLFYDNCNVNSNMFEIIDPILMSLKPKAIIRIKANMYTNNGQYTEHGWHQDYPYSHKAAIFYVNTNNGFTILEDGTKIESIANRMLIIDGSKPHKSTSCTDEKLRVNIGFNYF
jgi:hypothetical protein